MKKYLILITICLYAVYANASLLSGIMRKQTYYPTYTLGFNGGIDVYNCSGTSVSIICGDLTFGNAPSATFVKDLKSGDSLYRCSGPYGKVEYVVSPDNEHLCQVMYMYGEWTATTWYTASRDEQLAFYEANKNCRTEGLKFDYDWEGSSSSGSSSHYSNSSSSCTNCGGTGINKTPNTGGSVTSWIKYYNHKGDKCPYCGRYSEHFHDKCAHCMGSGHE